MKNVDDSYTVTTSSTLTAAGSGTVVLYGYAENDDGTGGGVADRADTVLVSPAATHLPIS